MATTTHNVLKRADNLNISSEFLGYSKVVIYAGQDEEGNEIVYSAGDDSGRTLEIKNEWATPEMAENILVKIRGFQYQPYEASGALLDPSAEIGDGVTVNDIYSGVYIKATTYGKQIRSDISAPQDEQIEHEFTVESATDRTYSRFVKQTKSMIRATATQIQMEVDRAVDADTTLQSQLSMQATEISARVSERINTEVPVAARQTVNAYVRQGQEEYTRNWLSLTDGGGSISSNASDMYYVESLDKYYFWNGNRYEESDGIENTRYWLSETVGGIPLVPSKFAIYVLDNTHYRWDGEKYNVSTDSISNTFGWTLTPESFVVSKGGGTPVMTVNKNGLEVEGTIKATGGTIGGFTINATSIASNGMEWGNTSRSSGVYVGTMGLQLGQRFKVDSSGNLTCSYLSASNASISGNVSCDSLSVSSGAQCSIGGQSFNGSGFGSAVLGGGNFSAMCENRYTAEYLCGRHLVLSGADSSVSATNMYCVTADFTQYGERAKHSCGWYGKTFVKSVSVWPSSYVQWSHLGEWLKAVGSIGYSAPDDEFHYIGSPN